MRTMLRARFSSRVATCGGGAWRALFPGSGGPGAAVWGRRRPGGQSFSISLLRKSALALTSCPSTTVWRAGAAQLVQQDGMQAEPDTGLGPLPQPTPGRHPGAAHGLRGDVAPGDTRPQHVHDAGECHAVRNAQPPWTALAPFGSRRHTADRDRRVQDPQLKPLQNDQLGRCRWVIELTIPWLSGYRRLSPRYELDPRNHLAFLGRAAALRCRKRLIRLTTWATV